LHGAQDFLEAAFTNTWCSETKFLFAFYTANAFLQAC